MSHTISPKLYPFWQLMLLNVRPFFREPAAMLWTFALPVLIALLMVKAFSGSAQLQEINVAVTYNEAPDKRWRELMRDDQQVNLITLNQEQTAQLLASLADAQQEIQPSGPLQNLLSQYDSLLILNQGQIYTTGDSDQFNDKAINYLMQLKSGLSGSPLSSQQLSIVGYRYVDWLIPGIIVLQILGLALFSISNGLVSDRQQGFFKRLKLSPFKKSDYIIGVVLARLFLLSFQLLLLLAIFYFMFDFKPPGNWANIAVVLFCGSACLCLLGVLIGARSTRVEVSTGIANMLYFPLMFLSGIYFQTSYFPDVFEAFVQWLPSTAFLDAFRLVANEAAGLQQVAPQLTILAGTSVVLFIAIYLSFDWGDNV